MRAPRLKELVRGRERLGWMKLVLAAGVVALIAGAWTVQAASVGPRSASVGPRCSAWDTRNEQTLRGQFYERYCGPGRAVLRVDGKLFLIKRGTCWRSGGGVGFGLIGYGGRLARGIWLKFQPAGSDLLYGNMRAGRNSVIDGEVQLPGFGSLPHTGSAVVAKGLKSGTFSLGSRWNPLTGRFTCA